MRIAVIGDIHANLPALRAVIDDVARIGADAIWCVGDVVGRGPHPNEVVDELRRLDVPTVQGNWDEAVGHGSRADRRDVGDRRGRGDRQRLDAMVRRPADRGATSAWLRQLPQSMRVTVAGRSVHLFHGAPYKQNEYLWAVAPVPGLRAHWPATRPTTCSASGTRTRHSTASWARRTSSPAARSAAGPMATRGLDTRCVYIGEPDIAVGFRAVDYDHDSVVRDMAAIGQPIDLLREPPAAHPHLPTEVAPGLGRSSPPSGTAARRPQAECCARRRPRG